jgi:hypothetical protein
VNLAEFAAAARDLAERAKAELAIEVARAGAKELLAALEVTTPVRTGALRASEEIREVSGSGAFATALVGPDIVYDRIQNDGGTIHVKRAKVLGTPEAGFFGKQVTIKGQHYMERAEEEAAPMVEAAGRAVLDEILHL